MGVSLTFHPGILAWLTILALPFVLYAYNPDLKYVSIWEPFCKEEKLYTPYVRVFHKGRNGALLRDRGPGFIDLNGLSDIYVCTNGLVMMYYAKTTAMGEVYEHGELHWTPHHCELYNPSPNSGMKSDFPKKCLLSILLIGHPQDYRIPALQMFVAPLYDKMYNGYVNATSLIMIGGDGECIIEKGAERARLRVRLDNSKMQAKIDAENAAAAAATPPKKLKPYPHMFCQLDVQRKLGQSDKGFITLSTNISFYIPPIPRDLSKQAENIYNGTDVLPISKEGRKEMGSAIYPRYKASADPKFASIDTQAATAIKLLALTDEVYAALLADRKMHFVGCLRYPEFTSEQSTIIINKQELYDNTTGDYRNVTPSVDEGANPFWNTTARPPWPLVDDQLNKVNPENRFKTYISLPINVKNDTLMYSTVAADTEAKINKTLSEIETAENNPPVNATQVALMNGLIKKEEILLSLWPYIAAYNQIYMYVTDPANGLAKKVEDAWKALQLATGDDLSPSAPQPSTIEPKNLGLKLDDAMTEKPHRIAVRKEGIAKAMSQSRYARRYEPYNRYLVKEYDTLSANYSDLTSVLKLKSLKLGPWISDVETLTSRFKVFKGMIKKTHDDLIEAIKYIERTGGPAKPPSGGDPFFRSFVDTVIEIADAQNLTSGTEPVPIDENDPSYTQAKACHILPTQEGTCNDIKPNTVRANKLLKNRQGKGLDWNVEDLWRQRVLDLIEEIFKKVCPYVSEAFPTAINRLIKGYLMGDPPGTGLFHPVNGSRLHVHNHNYQGMVYNSTYSEINPSNDTKPPSILWQPPPKLKAKTPFWNHIIEALEHCDANAVPMQFWHNEEGDKPAYITYRKFFHNNNSELHYDVEELFMMEKADQEYAFNWAVEMNWRIFATVLGSCMPKYETKIPLISARFYALYSQDFLSPLRQIWMSNRDNPVLRFILGNFYGQCRGEKWARMCMEAAFVESGDRSYRPPRYLYVNAFSEMNYFTTGPFAGTSGMLSHVGNGQS